MRFNDGLFGYTFVTYPVKEQTIGNSSPSERRVFFALLDDIVEGLDLALQKGLQPGMFYGPGVDAELGRDEALDASGDSGIYDGILIPYRNSRRRRHHGVLALQCGLEGVDGSIVNLLDMHAGWERGGRGLAGESSDVETSLLECLDDGLSNVPRSLEREGSQ